jgi:hypothetical protein
MDGATDRIEGEPNLFEIVAVMPEHSTLRFLQSHWATPTEFLHVEALVFLFVSRDSSARQWVPPQVPYLFSTEDFRCLFVSKNPKLYKILHHIESCDTCMEY